MRQPFLQPQKPIRQNSSSKSLSNNQRQVLTVSQLNKKTKQLVESEIGTVWLEGEISNFVNAASGHWYYTLKDNNAQIKCALFKFKNQRLSITPKEGDKVIVKGKVSLYEARGDYQMIADYMEASGIGDLQQQLNVLIKKLESHGLFSKEKKSPLPFLPKRIGVITSASGAAIHDVISVLERRCPMIPIIIYPTQVQGDTAANNIILALDKAVNRKECDVILMTRGGGSLEDLWSFNDETLAYKISECEIPIVAAIGHEVDITITELVADLRAATPSAAAELIAPDQQILWQKLDILNQDLNNSIFNLRHDLQTRLNIARLKLKDPESRLLEAKASIENLKYQLSNRFSNNVSTYQFKLEQLIQRLNQLNPKEQLLKNKHRLNMQKNKLLQGINKSIQLQQNNLALNANKLNTLSPLSTLQRGYSIAKDKLTQKVITKTNQIKQQQLLSIMLSDGEIECIVKVKNNP